jgi:hypothetical protein
MAHVIRKNWAYATVPQWAPDTEFVDCNFCQALPNTAIGGAVPATFRRCNLINCSVPSGSVIDDCTVMQMDYCYWVHKNDDNFSSLPVEVENCRHVDSSEVIQVDGITIETIYERSDKRLS